MPKKRKITKASTVSVRQGGNPAFAATNEDRAVVKLMAGFGYAQSRICLLIVRDGSPISVDTLQKHFALELATSRGQIDQTVFSGLYRACLRGDRWAIEFWLTHKNWQPDVGGFRKAPEAHAVGIAPFGMGGSSGPIDDGLPGLPPPGINVNFIKPDPSKKPDLLNETVFTPMTPTEIDRAETIDAKPSSATSADEAAYDAGADRVRPSYVSPSAQTYKQGGRIKTIAPDRHDPADPAYADGPPGKKHWMG